MDALYGERADIPPQINTCTGLSAVDHANDRVQSGYAQTGAGLGICSRHDFIGRNAVVDLQRGERLVICTPFVAAGLIQPADIVIWTGRLRRCLSINMRGSPPLYLMISHVNGTGTWRPAWPRSPPSFD